MRTQTLLLVAAAGAIAYLVATRGAYDAPPPGPVPVGGTSTGTGNLDFFQSIALAAANIAARAFPVAQTGVRTT